MTFEPPIKLLEQLYSGKGHGDCWSTCIAAITGRPREQLEDYHQKYVTWARSYYEGAAAADQIELHAASVFELSKLGLATLSAGNSTGLHIPQGLSIASGLGPRGCDHSCVAYDGQIVHDPHESREGLDEITRYDFVLEVAGFVPEGALVQEGMRHSSWTEGFRSKQTPDRPLPATPMELGLETTS